VTTRRQAIRRPRLSTEVDFYLIVGGERRGPGPWLHVALFLLFICIVVLAVLAAGGRFALL
jgi:hypothetical protein